MSVIKSSGPKENGIEFMNSVSPKLFAVNPKFNKQEHEKEKLFFK